MAPKKDKDKTAVTDPLEAAKIADAPPPPKKEEPPPAPPPPVVELPPEPPKPPGKLRRYRVAKTTTISMRGHITRLNEGDIVSESSYGPDGMRVILDSNVALIELE